LAKATSKSTKGRRSILKILLMILSYPLRIIWLGYLGKAPIVLKEHEGLESTHPRHIKRLIKRGPL
jgi:hypothetical protein